jgi:hypothetical protein
MQKEIPESTPETNLYFAEENIGLRKEHNLPNITQIIN